jgi:hypothetical protein
LQHHRKEGDALDAISADLTLFRSLTSLRTDRTVMRLLTGWGHLHTILEALQ